MARGIDGVHGDVAGELRRELAKGQRLSARVGKTQHADPRPLAEPTQADAAVGEAYIARC